MEDKLYQYMLEHKSFSIPEIQMKLSLPYKFIREFIARLEKDGDIILQPDGLEYSLDSFEFEEELDYDDYEELEILEDEEEDELNEDRIPFLQQRRMELAQRKESLRQKKSEECIISSKIPPKEYVWILWFCIKEDKVDIEAIKDKFSFPIQLILMALDWMKNNLYITEVFPLKVLLSKDLFLELYGDYELYHADTNEVLLYRIACLCVKNKSANINTIQLAFNLGFAKANELLKELERRRILSPKNEFNDRKVLIDEETLQKIFHKL